MKRSVRYFSIISENGKSRSISWGNIVIDWIEIERKYAFGKCLAFVLIMLRWWAVARAVPADFPKLSGASSWKQLHNATWGSGFQKQKWRCFVCIVRCWRWLTHMWILGVLSCRDSKSQQITESIHHRMNFGSKAATTSAESLIDSRGMSSSGTMLMSMNVCPINHDVVHVSL